MSTQIFSDRNPSSRPSWDQFWADVQVVVQSYWYPSDSVGRPFSAVIQSWGMFALLILLIVALVSINAFSSFWNRYVLDIVIEERDLSKYFSTLALSCILLGLITVLVGASKFVRKKIALDWYKWLSKHILKQYLNKQAYYKISLKDDSSNPDQRLAQEIGPIANIGLRFIEIFFEKILEIIAFLIILWTISPQITLYLIIYTIAGNLIALYLTQNINKINKEELESKAEYTYGLTHIRNHAESIAFFQGENQEEKIIERRFNRVLDSIESKIDWERSQDTFNRAYQSAIGIFSMFILTPLFIQDKIDYGEINQASMACFMFSSALGVIIAEWGNTGRWVNYVERLSQFSQTLRTVTKEPEDLGTIKTIQDGHLAFEQVTLKTPDYKKVIVDDLSLSVQPGDGLLIVGPSGRGKSSILRAMAGLWNAGKGRLVRPPLEDILFLPQRPYIILGTLREQLLYPKTNRQISDEDVRQVLKKVKLETLLSRVKDFDIELAWENILSLGEQQRLAFARILVNCPEFTILDEATSALDLVNEDNLYRQLQRTQATFISVGHRESLFKYHQWVLELLPDANWQLVPIKEYQSRTGNRSNPSQPPQPPQPALVSSKEDSVQTQLGEAPTRSIPARAATMVMEPTVVQSMEQDGDQRQPEAIASSVADASMAIVTDAPALSHQEINAVTRYALSTIKKKGSQGKLITTNDGLTYRYNKDPKVRKWILCRSKDEPSSG